MSKRTQGLERRANDAYDTPFEAVKPLLPHLPRACYFIEPCAGKGNLVDHLTAFGHTCAGAFDIAPRRADIQRRSVHQIKIKGRGTKSFFITNPPWKREILHPIIEHLASQLPTWLLFEADWAHTQQAARFMPICQKIVSVGRVRWIEGTAMDGMENCAWYLFDGARRTEFVEFYGRQG